MFSRLCFFRNDCLARISKTVPRQYVSRKPTMMVNSMCCSQINTLRIMCTN